MLSVDAAIDRIGLGSPADGIHRCEGDARPVPRATGSPSTSGATCRCASSGPTRRACFPFRSKPTASGWTSPSAASARRGSRTPPSTLSSARSETRSPKRRPTRASRRRSLLGICALRAHRRTARPDAASTVRLIPRGAAAPAARASSLGQLGRLRAPRADGTATLGRLRSPRRSEGLEGVPRNPEGGSAFLIREGCDASNPVARKALSRRNRRARGLLARRGRGGPRPARPQRRRQDDADDDPRDGHAADLGDVPVGRQGRRARSRSPSAASSATCRRTSASTTS